ncbi:MAG: AsmA-like C-terminal region-containing protein [Alphaproteobacteria bacterium]
MVGPVPLNFAKPRLETELNRRLGGYGIEFEETVIAWRGWRRGLDILATGVTLRDPRGLAVVELPELAVGLDASELIQGRIAPHRIGLLAPTIRLSRQADGSFGFRRAGTGTGGNSEQMTQGLVGALLTPADGAVAGLERVVVEDAVILIDDLAQQQDWRVDGATLEARRTGDGLRITLVGALTAGDDVVAVNLAADYSRFTDRVTANLDVTGLVPAMLARPVGPLTGLRGWNVPVNGSILINADRSGRIDRMALDLTADRGTLDLDLWPRPAQIENAAVEAVLDRNAGRFTVSKLSVGLGGGMIDGTAVLAASDLGILVEAEATVDRLPFRSLAAVWPENLKANTRSWFSRNITGGRIVDGQITLKDTPRTGGDARTDFRFAFGFQGLELHYIRPMPPMSKASGTAVLTPDAFEIRVDDGQIADPETGMEIELVSVHGLMSNLDKPITHEADINVVFRSGAEDIITLIDYEPLGYASDYGVGPQSLAGNARVQGQFRFPLIDRLGFQDVDFRIAGTIDQLQITDVPDYVREQPGTVSVVVEREGLEAAGELFLWNNPVKVTWSERFVEGEGLPTRFIAEGRLPPVRLYALGLPPAVELSDSIFLKAVLEGQGVAISSGTVNIDLTGTAVALPAIDWQKPAGVNGRIDANLTSLNGLLRPTNLSAKAADLDAQGDLLFDGNGLFQGAEFGQFKLGQTDLGLRVYRTESGPIDLRLEGRSLDVRPFLGDDDTQDDPPGTLDASITIDVGQAIGAGELVIGDVRGVLHLDASEIADAQLTGTFTSGEPLIIDYHPEGSNRSLEVQTSNAGDLLAALDLYDGARGGRLSLLAKVTGPLDNRTTSGTLDVRDFSITDAPGLARLLTLGSLTGIVDTLSGDGLSFDRLEAGFRHVAGDLTIIGAQAVGSQLGIRFDGRAFDDLQQLDIRGTLAPAYSLNTALNFVPLVGSVLSGGSGEGLFAFRFTVRGAIEDPDVSVNPLSALTPGILRGVFDMFDPPRARPRQPQPQADPQQQGPAQAPAGTDPASDQN